MGWFSWPLKFGLDLLGLLKKVWTYASQIGRYKIWPGFIGPLNFGLDLLGLLKKCGLILTWAGIVGPFKFGLDLLGL